MRGVWAQTAAGALACAVVAGLMLLPGHLLTSGNQGAPLRLSAPEAPAVVQVAPGPVVAGHRPATPPRVPPQPADTGTAELASVVVRQPLPVSHPAAAPSPAPAPADHTTASAGHPGTTPGGARRHTHADSSSDPHPDADAHPCSGPGTRPGSRARTGACSAAHTPADAGSPAGSDTAPGWRHLRHACRGAHARLHVDQDPHPVVVREVRRGAQGGGGRARRRLRQR